MRLTNNFSFGITACAMLLAIGCAGETSPTGPVTSPPPATVDDHDDHAGHDHAGHDHAGHGHAEHGHPSEGPHHGGLIELGNEEYHAELVHDDDAGAVTIYILDGGVTKQFPIDATEITINTTHDGKPEQFKLAATPDANDPAGKSSRFVSSDAKLAHHLDEEGAKPRLVLSINGKSYRGTISHDHDHGHEGHDH